MSNPERETPQAGIEKLSPEQIIKPNPVSLRRKLSDLLRRLQGKQIMTQMEREVDDVLRKEEKVEKAFKIGNKNFD